MLQALKEAGIPNKLIKVIHMTLNGSKAVMALESELANEFEINVGVRQEAVLFNFTLEMIIRKPDVRGNISTTLKQICVYADDIIIMARTKKALIEIFTALEREAKQAGLIINGDKTKYMVCTRKQNMNASNWRIAEYNFESVSSFICLGTNLNMKNEITYRITKGNKAYFANRKLLISKLLSRTSNYRLYQTIIIPVVTYGTETLTFTENDKNRLRYFERRILRKIYGPIKVPSNQWRIRTNAELEKLTKGADIVRFIKARQLKWLGHIVRME
jgi:hypothetical protein